MLNVRYDIWETNSSSTHAMIMCSETDYKALVFGQMMIASYGYKDGRDVDMFIPREEIYQWFKEVYYPEYKANINADWGLKEEEELTDEMIEDVLAQYGIAYTLDNYGGEYMERFDDSFTTPGGETVYAFGYYGNNW